MAVVFHVFEYFEVVSLLYHYAVKKYFNFCFQSDFRSLSVWWHIYGSSSSIQNSRISELWKGFKALIHRKYLWAIPLFKIAKDLDSSRYCFRFSIQSLIIWTHPLHRSWENIKYLRYDTWFRRFFCAMFPYFILQNNKLLMQLINLWTECTEYCLTYRNNEITWEHNMNNYTDITYTKKY